MTVLYVCVTAMCVCVRQVCVGVGQPGAIMQMLYRLRVVSGCSLEPDVSVRVDEVASDCRL